LGHLPTRSYHRCRGSAWYSISERPHSTSTVPYYLAMCNAVTDSEDEENKGHTHRVVDHVVEQRVSNLAQGLLTLGTMTGPLLIVLHLIPQAVLAGLFFVMGIQALEANGITAKLVFLARDRHLTSRSDPLARIERRWAIWAFVGLEIVGFGATFAITQTIAAIGFPVFILFYIPLRTFIMPNFFTSEELGFLDAPTASPFTMESVGGNHGQVVEPVVDDQVIQESDEVERGAGRNLVDSEIVKSSNLDNSDRTASSLRSRDGANVEKSA
jgi:hypothetical protein